MTHEHLPTLLSDLDGGDAADRRTARTLRTMQAAMARGDVRSLRRSQARINRTAGEWSWAAEHAAGMCATAELSDII